MTIEGLKAKFLGKSDEPELFEVEKGAAKRYAVAVADLNPLYLDEEVAQASRYGAILAPPGFYGWPVKQPSPRFTKMLEGLMTSMASAGFPDILDGGSDFDFLLPVRAGDICVCTRTITDLFSREGGNGRNMVFCVIESLFVNQNGQRVSNQRQTLIALSKAAPQNL